jgi:hypothetical protein
LGVACTEAILVVRTYGLAGRNKKFLIYLIVQFTVREPSNETKGHSSRISGLMTRNQVICIAVLVILGLSVRTLTCKSHLPTGSSRGNLKPVQIASSLSQPCTDVTSQVALPCFSLRSFSSFFMKLVSIPAFQCRLFSCH